MSNDRLSDRELAEMGNNNRLSDRENDEIGLTRMPANPIPIIPKKQKINTPTVTAEMLTAIQQAFGQVQTAWSYIPNSVNAPVRANMQTVYDQMKVVIAGLQAAVSQGQ